MKNLSYNFQLSLSMILTKFVGGWLTRILVISKHVLSACCIIINRQQQKLEHSTK